MPQAGSSIRQLAQQHRNKAFVQFASVGGLAIALAFGVLGKAERQHQSRRKLQLLCCFILTIFYRSYLQ